MGDFVCLAGTSRLRLASILGAATSFTTDASEYKAGELNFNDCPTGFEHMTNPKECRTAVKESHARGFGDFVNRGKPKGCFKWNNGAYYFNTPPGDTLQGTPICKMSKATGDTNVTSEDGTPDSDSCPDKFDHVTSQEECRALAKKSHAQIMGDFINPSREDRPKGCFKWKNGAYYFNTLLGDPTMNELTPICKKSVAARVDHTPAPLANRVEKALPAMGEVRKAIAAKVVRVKETDEPTASSTVKVLPKAEEPIAPPLSPSDRAALRREALREVDEAMDVLKEQLAMYKIVKATPSANLTMLLRSPRQPAGGVSWSRLLALMSKVSSRKNDANDMFDRILETMTVGEDSMTRAISMSSLPPLDLTGATYLALAASLRQLRADHAFCAQSARSAIEFAEVRRNGPQEHTGHRHAYLQFLTS